MRSLLITSVLAFVFSLLLYGCGGAGGGSAGNPYDGVWNMAYTPDDISNVQSGAWVCSGTPPPTLTLSSGTGTFSYVLSCIPNPAPPAYINPKPAQVFTRTVSVAISGSGAINTVTVDSNGVNGVTTGGYGIKCISTKACNSFGSLILTR